MTSSIPELLEHYVAKLKGVGANNCFQPYNTFEPATAEQLAALEALVGMPLPPFLRDWFTHLRHELPFGAAYTATRLEHGLEHMTGTTTIDFSQHLANVESWKDRRWDDGLMDRVYWKPQWVALASDGGGNEICCDLAPGPKGRVGQLISMEFQDGQGPYVGDWRSIEHMLLAHIGRLNDGDFALEEDEEYEDVVYIEFPLRPRR